MEKESQPLMPVRRLHNFVYCPRLFYLQWVENLFVESADTAEGSHVHRKVDQPSHFQADVDLGDRASVRSLAIDSEDLGLTGVVDLVESTSQGLEVIDYKRGSPKIGKDGKPEVKDNDAIQVAAYALMLEESGEEIKSASVYYATDRRRVDVHLTGELFQRVRETIAEAQQVATSGICPEPLRDDPRCLACSAYSICLPNESAYWSGIEDGKGKVLQPPRPQGDDGEILVVQDPEALVSRRGGEIQVRVNGKIATKLPIAQIQAIYLYGAIQVSAQAIHSLLERSIPIGYFSAAGRFIGTTAGLPQSGIDARIGQSMIFRDRKLRVPIAREIVRAKIHNQRVLLMRNGDPPDSTLRELARLRDGCVESTTLESIRGREGAAAAAYFGHFKTMLKGTAFENFDFSGRNRRPPRDPVNALLSQGYSILAKELAGICHLVGLDPFVGCFHEPRYGRPALALDLMEEFRPLIADSVAISLLNRQELSLSDFSVSARGVFLGNSGRKQFWRAWFRRLDTEVKHPVFEYRLSYRRMLAVQVRQYWRVCRGDAEEYYGFTTR